MSIRCIFSPLEKLPSLLINDFLELSYILLDLLKSLWFTVRKKIHYSKGVLGELWRSILACLLASSPWFCYSVSQARQYYIVGQFH